MSQGFLVIQNHGWGSVTPVLVHGECAAKYQDLFNQAGGPLIIVARGTIEQIVPVRFDSPVGCRWCYGDLTQPPDHTGGMNKMEL